jgi:hypothetical protein
LNLVKLDKMEASSFIIALYWTCTDIAVAPGWSRRESLSQVTGFDFYTRQGCLAARLFANEALGRNCVETLDAIAFRGEFRTDAGLLSECLQALWRTWCSHGTNDPDR